MVGNNELPCFQKKPFIAPIRVTFEEFIGYVIVPPEKENPKSQQKGVFVSTRIAQLYCKKKQNKH
jgi:hypothetical protein